jgi:Excalibur calcium-binding domain
VGSLLLDDHRNKLGRVRYSAALVGVAAAVLIAAPASPANAQPSGGAAVQRIPWLYRSCTNFNTKYRHGVGTRFAREKAAGSPAVTTFVRSTLLYNRAMSYNQGLDRDKDRVACEKR